MRATILIQAFCSTRSDLDMEKTVCSLPIRCEAKTSFLYISKSYLVFLLFKNFHCLEFSLARTKINFVPKPALYFIGYLISTSLWQVRQTQTQIIWRYSPNFLSKVFHFLQLIGYCCYCYNSRHIFWLFHPFQSLNWLYYSLCWWIKRFLPFFTLRNGLRQ